MHIAIAGIEKNAKNYIAACEGVGLAPAVSLDTAAVSVCAGLILPGGGDIEPTLYGAENVGSRDIDRALDEAQLSMADAFIRAGKPVLGICKGLQILNVYFGGTLIQHLATAQAHAYRDGDSVHACRSLDGTLMRRLYGERCTVNSAHHQALGRIGHGLRVTSFAPDGTGESAEHDTLPVFGVQWHPERMCFRKARPDTADGAAVFLYFKSILQKQ